MYATMPSMKTLRSNLPTEPNWTAYDIRFLLRHHIVPPAKLHQKTAHLIRNLVLALLITCLALAMTLLFRQGMLR